MSSHRNDGALGFLQVQRQLCKIGRQRINELQEDQLAFRLYHEDRFDMQPSSSQSLRHGEGRWGGGIGCWNIVGSGALNCPRP